MVAYCRLSKRRSRSRRRPQLARGHQTECLEDASLPESDAPVTCSAQAARSRRYRPSEPPRRPGRNQSNATTWGRPLPSPRSQGYPTASAGEQQQTIGRAAGGPRGDRGPRPSVAIGGRNLPKSCVLAVRRFWQAARMKWTNGARSVWSNHAVMVCHRWACEPLPRYIPRIGATRIGATRVGTTRVGATRHASDGPSRHA